MTNLSDELKTATNTPFALGVNISFTVIGTVSKLIFGMVFGFKIVLLLGAFCYVLALVALTMSRNHLSVSTASARI